MKPDRKKGQVKHPREVHAPARSKAEDSEPSAARGALPIWPFIALAVLLFWAMVYLDNHAGGFNATVYRPYTSTNELGQLVPVDPSQKDFFAGMAVYNKPTCVACHMANGQGTPPAFPPLAGSEWVLESDPSRIIRIVLDGLTGPIEVKGQSFNSQMLGWRTTLSDEEIANVITFVRKSWGNQASAVAPEQVAAIRKETEAHAGTYWTSEQLKQVPLQP